MSRRVKLFVAATVVLSLAAFVRLTAGPPAPAGNPPGTFAFAALGDAPYYPWEELQFGVVRRDLDAHELGFVLHVGDIFWRPCSDGRYRRSRDQFAALRHPLVLTPGDNEWFDCWERASGAHAPLERLAALRAVFYPQPERSLGSRPLSLDSQQGEAPFGAYVENARWSHEGVLFATVHIIGSFNGKKPFPTRQAADDDDWMTRTAAAAAWVRATFEQAQRDHASAVVLAFHGNPGFEQPEDAARRAPYEPFFRALEEEVLRFPGPVLAIHGNDHDFLVDHPLRDPADGRPLRRFTRLEVPGSPQVGWVRVEVQSGPAPSFRFESRVVPRWKYW